MSFSKNISTGNYGDDEDNDDNNNDDDNDNDNDNDYDYKDGVDNNDDSSNIFQVLRTFQESAANSRDPFVLSFSNQ